MPEHRLNPPGGRPRAGAGPGRRGGERPALGGLLRTFWSTLPGIARPDWDKLTRVHTDLDEEFRDVYERCRDFTMTTALRMFNLYDAVRYVLDRDVPGDIVECGVWKGGSAMVAARTLLLRGDTRRSLYLYDTYAGMTEPTELDVDWTNQHADRLFAGREGEERAPAAVSLEEVRENMESTGFPLERVHFVEGDIRETVPGIVPERISILRLDTDWYSLTKHELEHLYPLLSPGGVLILDDYGFWKGCKAAVDEYFASAGAPILLTKLDQYARQGIKL